MTTLLNRATPAQVRIFRAIAGAVRNTAHHHTSWPLSHPKAAASIAKRATGTLTAGWPDVLALRASEREAAARASASAVGPGHRSGGRGRPSTIRPLSSRLRGQIGAWAAEARRAGNAEREAAMVDVLRLMAREEAR